MATLTTGQVYTLLNEPLGLLWGDHDDGTFTQQWGDNGPDDIDGGFTNFAGAFLQEFAGSPATVVAIVAHARISATRSDGVPELFLQYDLFGPSDPDSPGGVITWSVSSEDFPVVADGVIRDYAWPLTLDGSAYTDVAQGLASVPAIEFYFDHWGGVPVPPGDPSINRVAMIHEVYLELVLSGLPPVVRKYPRDDGRGHSSASRLYPPVKAARIVGGYQ